MNGFKSYVMGISTLGLMGLVSPQALGTVEPTKYEVKKGATAVFEAVGTPSLLRIKGEGAEVDGELSVDGQKITGQFNLQLAEFTTGIGLRDRHMKEKYLETEKYPKAVFEIKSVKLPDDWEPGVNVKGADFEGLMTLKGKTQPVKGKVDIKDKDLTADAQFKISIEDYPLGVPSYLGVTVADEVEVKVAIPGFKRL